MKNVLTLIFVGCFCLSSFSQEHKVVLVPELLKGIIVPSFESQIGVSNFYPEVKLACRVIGQEVIVVKREAPFKVYELNAENENWFSISQVYNTLQTKIPSLRIEDLGLNESPRISIRNGDDTVVIVDGVRFNASILNSLNPSDIEKITISNSPIAVSYYLNSTN